MVEIKIDKFKLYLLELLLIIILLLGLFESNIISKWILAIFLVVYFIVIKIFLRKKKIISIYSKQVLILMSIFSFIYLALLYLTGLYFGFYASSVTFSLWGVMHYILPISIIIVFSELIRNTILSQNGKFNSILIFISMVLIDVCIYSQIYDLTNLDDFLTVMGSIVFASVSCNLLYNYISVRYGYKSIIVYRLVTSLYTYIIPIIPNLYIFFRSLFRMIFPYIIYLVLEYTYSKNDKVSKLSSKRKRVISVSVTTLGMIIIAMLISCKFIFGIMVIGSGSMSDAINKGDIVVYKSTNENIEVGDIILFEHNGTTIVHRVVDTQIVNDEYRYYTKGDANIEEDDWFITKDEINGIVLFRIKFVGYPTLWINEIFE